MIRHHQTQGAFVRESGASAPAPTLLYIHGLGESGLCFEGLLGDPKLQHFRHLAPDLPGYGKSPWTKVPRRLEEHAEWLGGWLRETMQEPVVVVGHSMGGVIGLILCERYPDQVRGFLNVEGNISLEDCGFSGPIASFDRQEFLNGGLSRTREAIYRDGLEDGPLRTYFVSMSLCDPRHLYLHSQELVELSGQEGLARRFAALETPRLYLLGSPRGTQAYSQSLLEAAEISWQAVEGAGHWPFLDQPEHFTQILLDFVSSLETER